MHRSAIGLSQLSEEFQWLANADDASRDLGEMLPLNGMLRYIDGRQPS